nr:MAG TPA: hypothetical protein [Bacteriophage sp.]
MSKNSKQREFTFKYKFGGKYWVTSVFADRLKRRSRRFGRRPRRFMTAKL